ncbi:hypothetical protein MKEN_00270000 [Mycena kentingensis (nom. inval.)]|nr:hypothetical protein MKEN_00270000 [Mycena kentingensis (nom. inval.)]
MPSLLRRDEGPGLDGETIYALKIIYLNLAAAAISYGVFLCVGAMSTYSLSKRGLRGNLARQILLAFTLVMLFSATAHLALYMASILVQFPTLAAEYVDPETLLQRFSIARTCLRRLTYFLSDIIVVWRAWVIWSDHRLVHAFLAICLVGTGATSLTLLVWNFNSTFHGTRYDRDAQNFLGTFGLLFTNFTATALIGYKLWYYRTNIKKYISRSTDGHTKVESILILLMESGGLYCVFWIFLMIGDYGYYGRDFELEWFQPNISGLYPTIIIFMVSRQMMISEEVLSYGGGSSAFRSTSTDRTRTVWFAPPSTSIGTEDASIAARRPSNSEDLDLGTLRKGKTEPVV